MARGKRFPIDKSHGVFDAAASREDNIPLMEYLLSINCPLSHSTTPCSAAKNGALNNSKWLLENKIPMEHEEL